MAVLKIKHLSQLSSSFEFADRLLAPPAPHNHGFRRGAWSFYIRAAWPRAMATAFADVEVLRQTYATTYIAAFSSSF